jgi:1-acyl-sn-glycerol-3-phosphate acyltransferase
VTSTERARRIPAERWLAVLARLCWFFTVPFVRYDVRGGRCASELRVGVIAANHRSMFDVVAGLICLHRFRRYPRLLIHRTYVEGTWVGPFARAIGAIPVDREGSAAASLDVAVQALRSGIPILVMPEGRLHWDPEDPLSTGPAKTGVARLASGAGVSVVAAALVGTERVMPPRARLPRFNPFRRKVVICQVADEELWLAGEDHRSDTESVMAEIRRLMELAVKT